jgi:hypothetical protein
MDDRHDQHTLVVHAVDDAIAVDEDLANGVVIELRDDAA